MRELAHAEEPKRSASYGRLCWAAIAKRSRTLVLSAAVLLTLVLLAAPSPSLFDRRGTKASATTAHADAFRTAGVSPPYVDSRYAAARSGAGAVRGTRSCPLVVSSVGYVDPLAGARVTPERIDQGVDYAGSGTLTAMGAARVTHVATSNTGWPGAFIELQLLGGADGGCYVFYAEGVIPASGLRVGETVHAAQAIATIIPGYSTGIEIGWGAGIGTKAYAAQLGDWSAWDDANSIATATGKNFSALIAALGGPPGKAEG